MNKKIIFIVLSLIISSCSGGNENTIDELEQQIVALEEKGELTPEEEAELEALIEEQDSLTDSQENLDEEVESAYDSESHDACLEMMGADFGGRLNCAEELDKNDPIFAKYYTVGEPDPEFNPGKFLPRHCTYEGEFNGEFYEETSLIDIPELLEKLDIDYFHVSQGLYEDYKIHPLNIEDYKGEYGVSFVYQKEIF